MKPKRKVCKTYILCALCTVYTLMSEHTHSTIGDDQRETSNKMQRELKNHWERELSFIPGILHLHYCYYYYYYLCAGLNHNKNVK